MRLARYASVTEWRAAAEGEQMPREVAVRTDVRQTVGRLAVHRVPAIGGGEAGDVGIERREFVHQLPGALHERLLARRGLHRGPVRTRHEQPFIVDPSNDMRGVGRVDDDAGDGTEKLAEACRHRIGQRQIRVMRGDVAGQRREQLGGSAGGDDDAVSGDGGGRSHDVNRCGAGPNPFDRRAFEQDRATIDRRHGEAEHGAIGVQRRAVAGPDGGCRLGTGFRLRLTGIDEDGVETGVLASLDLALDGDGLLGGPRNRQRLPRFEGAAHFQPPQQGREVEGGAPPRLPGPARRSQAEALLQLVESAHWGVGNPAERAGAARPAHPVGLDQDDLHSRRSKRVGGGTPGQSAADDDHVRGERPLEPGIRRDARTGIALQPGRPTVPHHVREIITDADSDRFRN